MARMRYFIFDQRRDKRFGSIDGELKDGTGHPARIFSGMPAPFPESLSAELRGGSHIPDFVYSGRLMLIGSAKAAEVIRQSATPAAFVPVRLTRATTQKSFDYWWINPLTSAELMDHSQSVFEGSDGIYDSIKKFVVRRDLDVADLVVSEETRLPVFTERLVLACERSGLTGAIFKPLDEYQTLV